MIFDQCLANLAGGKKKKTSILKKGDMDLDLNVVGVALGFPVTTAHYDLEYDVIWPQTAAIGIAHQLTDALNLSAEYEWYG